jgi:hypothetical protein
MYTVVFKRTGQVLATNLTLEGVDAWVTKNEAKYTNMLTVGMTIFVLDVI